MNFSNRLNDEDGLVLTRVRRQTVHFFEQFGIPIEEVWKRQRERDT